VVTTGAVKPIEELIAGTKGVNLFVRSWRTPAKARAVVAIVHGFNAHSGYYGWVAERLVAKGWAAYAVDLRGRGKSEGERFYVESFDDYVDDVRAMVALSRAREPGLPVFVLGHSAGGVIATVYALEHQAELAGLICESFAFKVPAPDFALAVLKGLSHVLPHAHVLPLKNELFSRDPQAVARMNADPLIAHETQPTQTVAAMVRADERLEREFPLIKLPVLILHGTEDKATKPEGSRSFFERAGSTDKTLKIYEGHYHDLLADVGREEVMTDVASWIEAHLPAAPRA
jgi:alpha-beta hydrolase superfamily lysophospholipase